VVNASVCKTDMRGFESHPGLKKKLCFFVEDWEKCACAHFRLGLQLRSYVAQTEGSTTGEPRPAALKNEVIHCDSGTNPTQTPA
jgi:hypothetical protein